MTRPKARGWGVGPVTGHGRLVRQRPVISWRRILPFILRSGRLADARLVPGSSGNVLWGRATRRAGVSGADCIAFSASEAGNTKPTFTDDRPVPGDTVVLTSVGGRSCDREAHTAAPPIRDSRRGYQSVAGDAVAGSPPSKSAATPGAGTEGRWLGSRAPHDGGHAGRRAYQAAAAHMIRVITTTSTPN